MNKNKVLKSPLWLMAVAVSLMLCACHGRQEMNSQVIVQNDAFTVTGDSVIEDTVTAWVPRHGDCIETTMSLGRLDSLYDRYDTLNIKFVQGKKWQRRQQGPGASMPEYKSGQRLTDALYDMSMATTSFAPCFAMAMPSTPVPVPMSSTR